MYSSLHPEVSGGDSIGVEIVVCAYGLMLYRKKNPVSPSVVNADAFCNY